MTRTKILMLALVLTVIYTGAQVTIAVKAVQNWQQAQERAR